MWVKNPDVIKRTWKGAIHYISNLKFCGYTDWRLANRKELRSLIHYGEIDSSSWLNLQGFSNIQPDQYWSSTTDAVDEDNAWAVHMTTGSLDRKSKNTSLYVFPVRGRISFAMTPTEGTIGTEVVLTGTNFGDKTGKVLIGKKALKILEWSESLIRCEITKALPPGTYDVEVLPKKTPSIIQEDAFTMKPPEIIGVDVDPVAGGKEVTVKVTGRFFGTKKGRVYLDYQVDGLQLRKYFKILSWPMTSETGTGVGEVTFLFPANLASGSYQLVIENQVGLDTFTLIED
jgi:hypothetical protein